MHAVAMRTESLELLGLLAQLEDMRVVQYLHALIVRAAALRAPRAWLVTAHRSGGVHVEIAITYICAACMCRTCVRGTQLVIGRSHF